MPASVGAVSRNGEYATLELALPGRDPVPAGILLFDPASDRLHLRLRRDWTELAEPEDAELLAHLEGDLARQSEELGAAQFLHWLEDTLSNTLRISPRQTVAVRDFRRTLERLFDELVLGREPARVIPFVTHLPLYSLRAAAGRFGEDMEVEPEDWVEVPAGVRPERDLYAVHVVGRSMEPEISDGSLALFRHLPAGSRQGKRVLVWKRGASAGGGEFTVKVYESRKEVTEDGWSHTSIRLLPLNPEFDAIEIGEGAEYRVLGELVRVLD